MMLNLLKKPKLKMKLMMKVKVIFTSEDSEITSDDDDEEDVKEFEDKPIILKEQTKKKVILKFKILHLMTQINGLINS